MCEFDAYRRADYWDKEARVTYYFDINSLINWQGYLIRIFNPSDLTD